MHSFVSARKSQHHILHVSEVKDSTLFSLTAYSSTIFNIFLESDNNQWPKVDINHLSYNMFKAYIQIFQISFLNKPEATIRIFKFHHQNNFSKYGGKKWKCDRSASSKICWGMREDRKRPPLKQQVKVSGRNLLSNKLSWRDAEKQISTFMKHENTQTHFRTEASMLYSQDSS